MLDIGLLKMDFFYINDYNLSINIHWHECFTLFVTQHYIKQHVFGRIFFVVTTLNCLTLGCHSKVNQKSKKEKTIHCEFRIVTNSYGLSYSWENDTIILF